MVKKENYPASSPILIEQIIKVKVFGDRNGDIGEWGKLRECWRRYGSFTLHWGMSSPVATGDPKRRQAPVKGDDLLITQLLNLLSSEQGNGSFCKSFAGFRSVP